MWNALHLTHHAALEHESKVSLRNLFGAASTLNGFLLFLLHFSFCPESAFAFGVLYSFFVECFFFKSFQMLSAHFPQSRTDSITKPESKFNSLQPNRVKKKKKKKIGSPVENVWLLWSWRNCKCKCWQKKKKSLRMKSKGLFKSKQTKNTTTYRQQRVKRLQMWNEQYQ